MFARKKIFLLLLLSRAIDGDDSEEFRKLVYHNPCTGSISRDEPTEEEMPCLTKTPTVSPSPGPTVPNEPNKKPVDKYFCPGEDCSFDFETGENVLTVEYLYSIETAQDATDPSSELPELEERLLSILASKILENCIADGDIRMLQTSADSSNPYKRRYLNPRRRLAPTGICSVPADEYLPEETCDPELDPSNNCYVIRGGVSVALDDGDSADSVKSDVLGVVEDAMDNNELLSDKQPEVKRVKLMGEERVPVIIPVNEKVAPVDDVGGRNIDGIIIGSVFAALATLLLAFLIGRKRDKEEEEDESPFGVVAFAGVRNGSFTQADSKDLGVLASAMDVHHCKSQTCSKCYHTNQLQFLPVRKTNKGAFASESCIEVEATGTRSPETSDSDSDENSVQTTEFH